MQGRASAPKIALVASGGAARGIAHLGVLRACEDLGIHPDIYVGTSSGAIVAAMCAQSISLDVLMDGYRLPWRRCHRGPRFFMRAFCGLPTLSDLVDPGHLLSGLFSIEKFERYLRAHLPINDFRKLPHPTMVTAVNIDKAQRVVFGTGHEDSVPISQAVAASCCVPGLFRPYKIGNAYHIDGEILRTLSADLAVQAGADVVIVSNIYRPATTPKSDRSIARKGLAPVLRQTINIMLTQKEQTGLQMHVRNYPHVTFIDVAPEIGMFGYLNRFSARSLIMRGYRTALRQLAHAKGRGVFGPVQRNEAGSGDSGTDVREVE